MKIVRADVRDDGTVDLFVEIAGSIEVYRRTMIVRITNDTNRVRFGRTIAAVFDRCEESPIVEPEAPRDDELRCGVDLMHPNGHTCEHGKRPGYDCAECQPEIDASLAKHETGDASALLADLDTVGAAITRLHDAEALDAMRRVHESVESLLEERRFISDCVDAIRARRTKLEDENARLRADNARWCARVKRVESRIDDAVDRLRGVGLPSAPEVFEHAGATSEDVESAIAFLDPNDAGTPIGPDDHAPGFEVVRALAKISAAMKARGT